MKRFLGLVLLLTLALVIPAQATGSTPTVVAAGTVDAQAVAATAGTYLCGFTVTETAGATAEVILRAGTDTNGTQLADVKLASGGYVFSPMTCGDGPDVSAGVFVDRVSGNTTLTIYTRKF